MEVEWANFHSAQFAQGFCAESFNLNAEQKQTKKSYNSAFRLLRVMISKTHRVCLSVERRLTFSLRKEAKASFINVPNNCWLSDLQTKWGSKDKCCKPIRITLWWGFWAHKFKHTHHGADTVSVLYSYFLLGVPSVLWFLSNIFHCS